MKFCPTCGKPLQHENAEICPACGCRIATVSLRGISTGTIIAVSLIGIFLVLCIIAAGLLTIPQGSARPATTGSAGSGQPVPAADTSRSVEWKTMADWSAWERAGSWSGRMTGACREYGPVIVDGHGEYGTSISLDRGSSESSIWRTFTDPRGDGWDTVTFVGQLTPTDSPSSKWVTVTVNDQIVFGANAGEPLLGNGAVFTVTSHFPRSREVRIRISNGQSPVWGGPPLILKYYSLKLSSETTGT